MIDFLENRELVSFVQKHLVCQGSLCQQENGYLYLKIADDFIKRLIPFVDDPEKEMPDYFSVSNYTGAHITVVYPEEVNTVRSLPSIGQAYRFNLGSYFRAQIQGKLYFGCAIESAGLTQLRADLGLPLMLNFKGVLVPFHFTIAVKRVRPRRKCRCGNAL